MPLVNQWVGYVTRSYDQMKENILLRFQSLIPEMTDHTESNIFVKMIGVWAGIGEMLGYYIDKAARETFLSTAQQFASAVKIAAEFNYRIKSWRAASVDLTFILDAPATAALTIPIGTELATDEGISYFTTAVGTIGIGETQTEVPAVQRIEATNINVGLTDGSLLQQFSLVGNVVDAAISVTIDGVPWTFVEDFVFSVPTDKVFTQNVDENGQTYIQFGDGVNGELPAIGRNVLATYYLTSGSEGNVGQNTITNIVGGVSAPSGFVLTVTNNNRASGGGARDTLEDLRRRIPISHRTQDEAVTAFDYSNLALLVAGVAQAVHNWDCGKTVDVYVAPEGGGIASSALLAAVKAFYDDNRRMVTTLVEALPAGNLEVIIGADIVAENDQFNSTVKQAVEDTLVAAISVENKAIREPLFLGDVYALIENTAGVRNSRITTLSLKPFGTIVSGTTSLLWDVFVESGSTSIQPWRIKMVSSTSYQLFKGSSFIGVYNTGVTVTLPEVRFTVQDNAYSAGDSWSFVTYPVDGDIVLEEFSIIQAFPANLALNVTGGI